MYKKSPKSPKKAAAGAAAPAAAAPAPAGAAPAGATGGGGNIPDTVIAKLLDKNNFSFYKGILFY